MAGPVRIEIYYDEGKRPTGRGRTNRERRADYDRELERLIPRIGESVKDRLNEVEEVAGSMATKPADIATNSSPFVAPARQSNTLFVEIRLNANGPYQANSDSLRIKIAGDILSWLGYYTRVGSYLEINLVFVPMSGVRVLFDGRSLRDSWGEVIEPDIGSKIPSS